LAGGAVRDAVTAVAPNKVKDLDMSGTAPTGRFADIAYQALRAAGMSEGLVTVSPSSLICAMAPPGTTKRMIEYRGLSVGGFPFPVVGSGLTEDARHRDYSFNSLLYDVLDRKLFDPSGTGLRDLLGTVRCFRPLSYSTNPYKRADVLVRAMKFALRWDGEVELDLRPLHAWTRALPPDLCDSLTDGEWSSLRRTQRDIPESLDRQRQFAASLPEPGSSLVARLVGGR
jgi:poly(A) polymerase